jgi:hypothetical protein
MEGSDAAPGALEAFLDDLAGRALEGFGLSGLYEAAGVPFDVAMWSPAATPRVAIGAGAVSAYDLAVAEVPADLSAAQRKALSIRFALRASEGTDRVVIMRAWHGFSAEDLLSAERAPLGEVLGAVATTASCPAARRELACWAAGPVPSLDGAAEMAGEHAPFRDGGALRHRSPGQHEAPQGPVCPGSQPGPGWPRRHRCSRQRETARAAVAQRARPRALGDGRRDGPGPGRLPWPGPAERAGVRRTGGAACLPS